MSILYLGEVVRNLLMTTSSEDSLNLFDWGQPHIYTIKWYTHDHIHKSVLSRRHNYFYLLDVTSEQTKNSPSYNNPHYIQIGYIYEIYGNNIHYRDHIQQIVVKIPNWVDPSHLRPHHTSTHPEFVKLF